MGGEETLVECLDMDGTEFHRNIKTAHEIVTPGRDATLDEREAALD